MTLERSAPAGIPDTPLTEKQLRKRCGKRSIGEDILQALREFNAARRGQMHVVEVTVSEENATGSPSEQKRRKRDAP